MHEDANWTEYCKAIIAARVAYDYDEYFLTWVLATKRAANKYLTAMGYRQPKPEEITS
jgi:hypothetical protein